MRLARAAFKRFHRRYRQALGKLYRPPLRPPLSLLYRGNKVECPVCRGTFRRFAPTIRPAGPIRRNARCPGCGARDRHRYLWLYLQNRTSLFHDRLRVLHVAPERILERKLKVLPNLEDVSGDLDRPRATVKMDVTDIPFRDGEFDAILCSHVLEHVADDRKAMAELHRVLKPGGWAIILVPIKSSRSETFEDAGVTSPLERERLFGQADHVRIYGRDFEDRLEAAGFSVTHEDFARELGEDLARRYGLRRRSDFYVSVKPRP